MKAPVETKVLVASSASGLVSLVGDFAIWLIAVAFWHADPSAGLAEKAAMAAVPFVVASPIRAAISAGVTFLAGYMAPHTLRPEEAADVIRAIGGLPPEHKEG